MKLKNIFFLFLFLQLLNNKSFSQEGVITAGFQYKPIFSNNYFKTGALTDSHSGASVTITPTSGFCGGMVIRRGFTSRLSFETGINYVKRNYSIVLKDSALQDNDKFKFIGYEIPVSLLVYIQLGEHLYMDVSLGMSMDFYPSDIYTHDSYYHQNGLRKNWFSPAVLSNLGFEYRTEKSGYFYLGASFHKPFDFIARSFVRFENKNYNSFINDLNGNYLTVDIRYFFQEDPLKKQRVKTKGEE